MVAGAHRITETPPPPGQVASQAAVYRKHPDYNPTTNENDVALVKLATPIKFSEKIQPICLPAQDEPLKTGDAAVVTGWGSLRGMKILACHHGQSTVSFVSETPFTASPNLMQVAVPVVSDSDCSKSYGTEVNTKLMVCAGFEKGGKDSCQV